MSSAGQKSGRFQAVKRGWNRDEQLLDAMATAVVVIDAQWCVTCLNPAAETLLDASIESTHGTPLGDLIDLNDEWQQLLEQVHREHFATMKREIAVVLHSNRSCCVDASLTPLGTLANGGLLLELNPVDRLNAISEDAQVREAQASAQQVIRGLAHEVKNPLGGIRGAAQLLAKELGDNALTEYTDVIMEEADRLRNLVDRLLGPREQLSTRPMNIHEVLERVRQLTGVEAGEGLLVKRDYDPSLPEFEADPDQLTQVLLNITRNASQALGGEGTILLRTRARRQYTLAGKRCKLVCAIEIIDDGPGIPAEVLPQLFLPMITSSTQGNGLGLSIAQRIANRHGGLIQCDSRPGETRFTLLLPMEH